MCFLLCHTAYQIDVRFNLLIGLMKTNVPGFQLFHALLHPIRTVDLLYRNISEPQQRHSNCHQPPGRRLEVRWYNRPIRTGQDTKYVCIYNGSLPVFLTNTSICYEPLHMMTSSSGNIYRVTGPLWGNHPLPVDSPSKGHWCGALKFSLTCA